MNVKLTFNIILASIIILIGCDQTGISDENNRKEVVKVISDNYYGSALNGYNNLIALSYKDNTVTYRQTLRLYDHDIENPDNLQLIGSVYLGVDTLYHRVIDMNINSKWVTVVMHHNLNQIGYVSLVSLENLPELFLNCAFVYPHTIDTANANNSFLFVSSNTELIIYDISDAQNPISKGVFSLNSSVTSSVAIDDGFFILTNNGYAVIDTSDADNITIDEKANLDIRNSRKAYLYDGILYISGPSKHVGNIKLVKIDISTPTNPTILMLKDDIVGNYVEFSYDNISKKYSLLMDNEIRQYIEDNNDFYLDTSALFGIYVDEAPLFYSINDRMFVSSSGLGVYKFQ